MDFQKFESEESFSYINDFNTDYKEEEQNVNPWNNEQINYEQISCINTNNINDQTINLINTTRLNFEEEYINIELIKDLNFNNSNNNNNKTKKKIVNTKNIIVQKKL